VRLHRTRTGDPKQADRLDDSAGVLGHGNSDGGRYSQASYRLGVPPVDPPGGRQLDPIRSARVPPDSTEV